LECEERKKKPKETTRNGEFFVCIFPEIILMEHPPMGKLKKKNVRKKRKNL
jgi:hypothetical protein